MFQISIIYIYIYIYIYTCWLIHNAYRITIVMYTHMFSLKKKNGVQKSRRDRGGEGNKSGLACGKIVLSCFIVGKAKSTDFDRRVQPKNTCSGIPAELYHCCKCKFLWPCAVSYETL